ncbi:Argininosuccinate lyase [Fusarium bulbicola]|nr:Argininosuccinate lyase [Fusarium bulbicola]
MAEISNTCCTEETSTRAHTSLTDARLHTRASSLLVTNVNKVELDDELVRIDQCVLTDLAHAVMLTRTGIFDALHDQSIVKILLHIRAGEKALKTTWSTNWARDAGFTALDIGAELTGVLAVTLSGISRLASDLQYWSFSEIWLVRIHSSLCGTSSMMPQKRNPMVLERIRGLAGSAVGWSASQLGFMHKATSTDLDQSYIHNLLPSQCFGTVGAIALLCESTVSAVADALVASHEMSFRQAHESVAQLVASHERSSVCSSDLRTDIITDPALKAYSDSQIQEILDPKNFVASRVSSGGTSIEARDQLAAIAKVDLLEMENRLQHRVDHIERGLRQLLQDAQSIALHSL